MTDPLYQHDVLVIDRSGSIGDILAGMQEGLDGFLAALAALEAPQGPLRKVTASLWDFDTEIACRASFARPAGLAASYRIQPRGATRLLDAIGRAVTAEGERLAALPEDQRPGQVVALIASDGLENDSREWDFARASALLEGQQRQWRWQVTFLGTNMDAIAEAARLQVPASAAMQFTNTSAGAKMSFGSAGAAVTRYAMASAGGDAFASLSYTQAERDAAAGGEQGEGEEEK
jgi:hypothetical protein